MISKVIIHSGYAPAPRAGLVLLSGLDSAAALHWTIDRYAPVVALGFDYHQAPAELAASQVIAERRGVPWYRETIIGIGQRANDPGRDEAGVSRAFIPARNGLFVWHAANLAARMFHGGRVDIVVGCNLDDAAGFPDCRQLFIKELSRNVGMGLYGSCDIAIVAPWIYSPKSEIVTWAAKRAEALEDIRYSITCYRGDRCGACDACTVRAKAFATAGVEDGADPAPTPSGGDPSRERRP